MLKLDAKLKEKKPLQSHFGPPSLKKDCLKKRKLALTRSTQGWPLSGLNAPKAHVYHASDK